MCYTNLAIYLGFEAKHLQWGLGSRYFGPRQLNFLLHGGARRAELAK